MKKTQLIIGMATLLIATGPTFALTRSQVKSIQETLSRVAVPELPAKAVALVRAAAPHDRAEVASTAVRAIVAKHRAAGPVVVAAISRELPEFSAAATQAAVVQAPEATDSIVAAAIQAAPEQARSINTMAAPSQASRPTAPPVVTPESAVRISANGNGNNGNGNGNGGPSQGQIKIKDKPIKYQGAHPKPPKDKPNKKNGRREE